MKAKILIWTLLVAVASPLFFSCKKGKTYMQLRKEENAAIDKFLSSDGRHTAPLPEDGNFLTFENSENPPFYILPDEVYMQIISTGYIDNDSTSFFRSGDKVYFRYSRMSLTLWANDVEMWSGNWSDATGSSDTYFFDYTTQTGANYSMYHQYGLGIEYPLQYVGNGAMVNLVVPSKMGFAGEISGVIPYLFKIRYTLKEN